MRPRQILHGSLSRELRYFFILSANKAAKVKDVIDLFCWFLGASSFNSLTQMNLRQKNVKRTSQRPVKTPALPVPCNLQRTLVPLSSSKQTEGQRLRILGGQLSDRPSPRLRPPPSRQPACTAGAVCRNRLERPHACCRAARPRASRLHTHQINQSINQKKVQHMQATLTHRRHLHSNPMCSWYLFGDVARLYLPKHAVCMLPHFGSWHAHL